MLQTQIFTRKYRSWLRFYSEFLRKNLAAEVSDLSFFKSRNVYPQDMFGEESVPKIFSGDRITVSVDTRKAVIDVASLEVSPPALLRKDIKNYWLLMITRWHARRTPPSSRSFKQQWASSIKVLSHFSLISEHLGLSSSLTRVLVLKLMLLTADQK